MANVLDRWDAAPFSSTGIQALAEAVLIQLTHDLGPADSRRVVRARLAKLIIALRHGAAGEGLTISGSFRTREDCREALSALLVPSVDPRFARGKIGGLDEGGRPPDRGYQDLVASGFSVGRALLSEALGKRATDAQVARWLAEEFLPECDRKRGRPPRAYEARSVQRTWQRIRARERSVLAALRGGDVPGVKQHRRGTKR